MSNRPSSSGGALKQLIENGGLQLAAYRDQLPPKGVLPCVTIDDDVTSTRERHGDPRSSSAHDGESEVLFVHLWQPLRDQNKRPGERFTLARDLTAVLASAAPFEYGPDDAPVRCYGLRIDGRARIIEGAKGSEIAHTTLTVTMRRDA